MLLPCPHPAPPPAGHGGIVASLRETGGSLLLVNVHVVPQGPLRERIKALLREAGAGALPFRILMTSEQPLGDLGAETTHIRVPPVSGSGSNGSCLGRRRVLGEAVAVRGVLGGVPAAWATPS